MAACVCACGRIGYDSHMREIDAGSTDAGTFDATSVRDAFDDAASDLMDLEASDASIDVRVSVTPTSGLSTTEAGGTDTFTISLKTAPSADVTIALSSDTPSEATVSPASVTFTSLNWASPQTIRVTGVDDAV